MVTSESRIDVLTRLGRAMSDPSRAHILAALTRGPVYPAELAEALGMTRPNVSNHLACLRGCGLVVAEAEGRRTRYSVADPHLAHALTALVDVVLAVDDGAPCPNASCDVPGCCTTDAPTDVTLLAGAGSPA